MRDIAPDQWNMRDIARKHAPKMRTSYPQEADIFDFPIGING
jgi:hypothetical protein